MLLTTESPVQGNAIAAPGLGQPENRRVVVRLDPQRLWRWQVWLLDALAAVPGLRIEIDVVEVSGPFPAGLRVLLQLERQVFRLGGEQAADILVPGPVTAAWPAASGPADLVIDLSGSDPAPAAQCPTVRPLYLGHASDEALVSAVLTGGEIRLSFDGLDGELRPALDSPEVLTRALNGVFSTLLRACLRQVATCREPRPSGKPVIGSGETRPIAPLSVAAFGVRTVRHKLADRLTDLCVRAPHWRVGWRAATSVSTIGRTRRMPAEGYALLPDDGERYYADPFVLEREGSRTLFVEEYPYATGRGLISAAPIDPDGRIGTPRPVLEEAHHLSYPFVFSHGGAVWMIPESSASRRVELYRAARFPDRWERVAVLLDDINASDVTLTGQDGHWWMFAATQAWQSSCRDTLSLFGAPDLLGPWSPHPANPVLVDRRAARPAGNLFRMDGHLWRPAQDATRGYGSALSLCRVDALAPDRYEQSIAAIIEPGGAWAGKGFHTLNFEAGIEVVDGLF